MLPYRLASLALVEMEPVVASTASVLSPVFIDSESLSVVLATSTSGALTDCPQQFCFVRE